MEISAWYLAKEKRINVKTTYDNNKIFSANAEKGVRDSE